MNKKMDEKDMEKLVKEHQPRIRSFILSRVSNKEDAEDTLQDVFYQFIVASENTYNPIENISAWLFRVAKNIIINKGKKKKEEKFPEAWYDKDGFLTDEFALFPMESDYQDPEERYMQSLVWQELHKALSELPEEQRTVFEWTEFEGTPIKKISTKTGIPANTLLSRKHYAVKHLRKRLKVIYDELIL